MKITAPQGELAGAIGLVSRAVAARSPLPITSNILMATEEGRLKLVGTSLDLSITTWLDATVEQPGAITLPARLLSDFVRTLPDGDVELELDSSGRRVTIGLGRDNCRIAGLPAADFPPARQPTGHAISLTAGFLRDAIAKTAFACSKDDARPILKGVRMSFGDGKLSMAASDGFRLSMYEVDCNTSFEGEIVVPGDALKHVAAVLGSDDDTEVVVSFDETASTSPSGRTHILFKVGETEVTSSLIPGTFPNFTQLIPSTFMTTAKVLASALAKEARTAAVFAKTGAGALRMMVDAERGMIKLLATTDSEVVTGDNKCELPAEIEGKGGNIAFSVGYVQEALAAMGGATVLMQFNGPSDAGLFTHESFRHIIMPMFVQW